MKMFSRPGHGGKEKSKKGAEGVQVPGIEQGTFEVLLHIGCLPIASIGGMKAIIFSRNPRLS